MRSSTALTWTSTGVERVHAIGRYVDERGGHQRIDSRAGVALAMANNQGQWLGEKTLDEMEVRLDAARAKASEERRITMKAMLIAAGRAKRAEPP